MRFLGGGLDESASALSIFGTVVAIDPGLKTPYTMNFSLGVQRELAFGLFADANFVGNLGRHLTRNPDINVVPFDRLLSNLALPPAQRSVDNALRPFLGYRGD